MSGAGSDRPDRRLRQTLKVAAVTDGQAVVEADRASGCGGCAVSSACAAKALIEIGLARKAEQMALDPAARVAPGDSVEVSMPSGAFVTAAALAFLAPALALVAMVGLAAALELSNAMTALLCLPVLALSFWPLARAERRGKLMASLRIERVVPAGRAG